MASGCKEPLQVSGHVVQERASECTNVQDGVSGQATGQNQNPDSTPQCDQQELFHATGKAAEGADQILNDSSELAGPAKYDHATEAGDGVYKLECETNKIHPLESAEALEVYPSIDPDGLRAQSNESTQQAFEKLTGLLLPSHIQHKAHGSQNPNIFRQLQLNRTCQGNDIQDDQVQASQVQSAERNVDQGIGDAASVELTDSSTSAGTTGDTCSVQSGNSSTASNRRSKYQSSGDFWQEEDYSQNDVFNQVQYNVPYIRQTSDTGSLPDVIMSISSTGETTKASPDLLLRDPGCAHRRTQSQSDNTYSDVADVIGTQSSFDEASARRERKLEMEGKVHDPKVRIQRQVSFNKQISVCENGFRRTLAANEEKSSAGSSLLEHSVDPSNYGSFSGSEFVARSPITSPTSAEDKRIRFSHRTSGYGTGDSSKNSTQNGSTEENINTSVFSLEDAQSGSESTATWGSQIGSLRNRPELSILDKISSATYNSHPCTFIVPGSCGDTNKHVESSATDKEEFTRNTSYHNEAALPDQNQPNLSILTRKISGGASGNSVAQNNSFIEPQKHPIGTDTFVPSSQHGGQLPNLSILGSHESSLMVSPSELISEEHEEVEQEELPLEIQHYLTSTSSGETSRTPASDSYALETLREFQKSTSAAQKVRSQCSQDKMRRYSERRTEKPLTSRAFAQKVREELIASYVENMLFYLSYSQPDCGEVEQVMQCIQQVMAPDASPSPMTPLTPQVRQDRGGTSPCHRRRIFYFQTQQSVDLQHREKKLQEILVRSSRCDYYLCPDHSCRQGKQMLQDLEKSLLTQPSGKTYMDYMSELFCLFDHSQQCDEFKCPVPWCNFLSWKYSSQRYEDISLEQVTKKLTEFVLHPTLKFTSTSANEEMFCPLTPNFTSRPVIEGKDWIVLVRMGKFGTSVLAKENQALKEWVIKRVQLTHPEADNRLQVYRRLNNHGGEYIVTYLWMKQTGKVLYVCTEFETGGSLHDHISTTGPFEARRALYFFSQVLSAAAFLHDLKILFLYWNAKNVVLSSRHVAKLCNFSTAVCYYDNSYDLEELSSLVPATLLPPELLTDQMLVSLCPEQDSWGLGCLLKELITGLSSRQELIHEDRTETERQIRKSRVPNIPESADSSVQEILHRCWKVIPQERSSASQLRDFITKVVQ